MLGMIILARVKTCHMLNNVIHFIVINVIQVIRMMDCQVFNQRDCFFDVDGLPDKFDGQLDEYSHDVVGQDIGPRRGYDPNWVDHVGAHNPNPVNFVRRGPKPSLLIQLAFHDCLRYEDGTGGCDGCLNWAGVGYRSPFAAAGIQKDKPELVDAWPKPTKTNNNKLQLSARTLELIYTMTDWPPGSKTLPFSLRESGKSRADLWQFAGTLHSRELLTPQTKIVMKIIT